MKKSNLIVTVFVALAAVVILGYVLTHENSQMAGTIAPVGTTNTSSIFLSNTLSLVGPGGTTTSVFNNTGYDLAERSVDVMCQSVGTSKTPLTGTGLASLTLRIATSSINTVSGDVGSINTNYLANMVIGTSTTDSYNSTTTEGVIQSTTRIIPNGTWAIISSNATNTASCAVGINAFRL